MASIPPLWLPALLLLSGISPGYFSLKKFRKSTDALVKLCAEIHSLGGVWNGPPGRLKHLQGTKRGRGLIPREFAQFHPRPLFSFSSATSG